jgi:hypothetical protein
MFSPLAHTDPPSVSAVNAVVLTAVGEEAVLLCAASGVPPPRVIWYRGEFSGEKPRKCPPRPWTYSFPKGPWQAGTPNREGVGGLSQEGQLVPATIPQQPYSPLASSQT